MVRLRGRLRGAGVEVARDARDTQTPRGAQERCPQSPGQTLWRVPCAPLKRPEQWAAGLHHHAAHARTRAAPARRSGPGTRRAGSLHGIRSLLRGLARARRSRRTWAGARLRLDYGPRTGAGARHAGARRQRAAVAAGPSGPAPASHRCRLPVRRAHPGAGRRDARSQLDTRGRNPALELGAPAEPRGSARRGALRRRAPAGAGRRRRHPRRLPAAGRCDPADGCLDCDRHQGHRQWPDGHDPHGSEPWPAAGAPRRERSAASAANAEPA